MTERGNGDGLPAVGDVLKQRRQAAQLTQRELAARADVSVGVVRDLEQGITGSPRPESLLKLAGVLGTESLDAPRGDGAVAGQGSEGIAPAGRPSQIGSGLSSEGESSASEAGPQLERFALFRELRPAAGVYLQILGPMTAARDGTALRLGSSRHRLVLGLLAITPNEVVRRGQIADAVWGDVQPRNAGVMIQSGISALRRLLDPSHPPSAPDGLIVSVGSGYRLNVTARQLDLIRFRELAAEARSAASAEDLLARYTALERAVQLWRGDPLGDLDGLSDHPAVTGLARLRDRAIIEYAECCLQLAKPDGSLELLEQLTEREPLNERAVACYMLTLAATGQHAAALEAFEQIRRRLSDEYGMPPGGELRAAHDQVVRQQVTRILTAQARARPTYQVPGAVPDFSGRSAELAQLTRLLDEPPRAGAASAVVICGMPGVGKTALALEAASRLRQRFPDGQLWAPLSDEQGRWRGSSVVLAELLRALGEHDWALPKSGSERAALYRSRLAGLRLLIVADGAGSASQVLPLLPGQGESALLVTSLSDAVVAHRSGIVQLSPLTPAEGLELLSRIVGAGRVDAEPKAAADIVRACDGLPLAISIIGMKLAARRSWRLTPLAARLSRPQTRLDELVFGQLSVRDSFRRAYQHLDHRSRALLERLSLPLAEHPGDPDIAVLTDAAGADAAAAALAQMSLLTTTGAGGCSGYRLHQLLSDYVSEQRADYSKGS
jgi:DNA-binding SARP family transcriptional activator/DNA-binding XRE family transcriptional regulator